MTSAVARSRPFAAGARQSPGQPPAVLCLGGRRGAAPPARCSALASPEKQSTSKLLPPAKARPAPEKEEEEETDYNEVAAALETIYKLSPSVVVEEEEEEDGRVMRVVRSRRRGRGRRMDLGRRMAMRREKGRRGRLGRDEFEEALIREYAVSAADMGALDWKRMKIPPVLTSAQSLRLFKLMQPLKGILKTKEDMQKERQREPTDAEIAEAMNMSVQQLRRHVEVGRPARNKLIKHNLRLVLYAINKYYPDLANDERFDDLCQAGANGLITGIDRFEPKRGFRLSTYALFWIRHSIARAITLSSFTRYPFAMETERQAIRKTNLNMSFELGRAPTAEEVIERVGISPQRYHDVLRMTKPIYSLNARNRLTQQEHIDDITDEDAYGVDKRKQRALLRIALDDLLDSLKPKESLVIRQRFGLDGRGKRTLGEIAGNLKISREMVRKHELKGIMKLKHPTRLDYLRRYL